MTPDELERLIAAQLHALPTPTAPVTLARRVRTAVAPNRPAVRPWAIWPEVWRAAFALGAAAVVAVAATVWWIATANANGAPWWQTAVEVAVGTTNVLGATRDGAGWAASGLGAFVASPVVLAVIATVVGAALAVAGLCMWLSLVARSSLAWSTPGRPE
jgi:hypothetical protein